MTEYHMPTEVEFGDGSLDKLGSIGLERRCRLYVGKHSWRNNDVSRVLKQLKGHIVDVMDVAPNPDISFYDAQIKIARSGNYGLVIGMGGGSVMDVGKVVAYAFNKEGNVKELIGHGPDEKGLPYVAIPTTAGTGSEVTMWATVWDRVRNKKLSLSKEAMYPDYAIVDPELTEDMPLGIIAETGMDALSQAIEAFWAKKSNPTSDNYARQAIQLVMDKVVGRYQGWFEGEDDVEARMAMSLGSLTAGRAFSNTATTGVHSVSYPLTLRHGVSHGRAVGMLLPVFIDYNSEFIGGKSKELEEMEITPERITGMLEDMAMPTRLSQVGVYEEDISLLASEGFTPGRADNNPGPLNQEVLEDLLRKII
tara:strand:- start:605 stop:1699 length:1095 start_codon:yes stop_codon:yes gene_type:complete